ncbi:MAG: hypothetical protein M3069_06400 [Chloroflexota bacterium]|nr:hypothetical protein [Chloroflexota bacterium]
MQTASTPRQMADRATALAKGVAAGLVAGIPQVLLTQAEARLLGLPANTADIGPRFVQRVAQQFDADVARPHRWLIAGGFHFGYAAGWGVLYTLLQRWRPAQPHVGGPLLAALIYALAFSPWGAATQTGTEHPVETRPARETLLHWTAALAFSLSLAYLYARLERWPRDARAPSASPGATD